MRVLVLGGTSFIGPHVCRALVAQGHSVTVFHRGKTTASLPPDVTVVRGDRHHLGQHVDALRAVEAEVVVDMICYTRHDAQDLVEVFGGYARRAVVASSADVYRNFGGLIGVETAPPDTFALAENAPLRTKRYPFRAQAKGPGDSMYDYEKLDVEESLRGSRLPAALLRLPMVFGEGDRQRRLSTYLKQVRDGGRVVLGQTHAQQRAARGYVENMAQAIVLAALAEASAGQTYNVADEPTLTELEFARAVVGDAAPVEVVPDHDVPAALKYPGDPHYPLALDSTKIRRELGYAERVALPDAVARTAAWERQTLG